MHSNIGQPCLYVKKNLGNKYLKKHFDNNKDLLYCILSKFHEGYKNDVKYRENSKFSNKHFASAFGSRVAYPFTKGHEPLVFRSSLNLQNY